MLTGTATQRVLVWLQQTINSLSLPLPEDAQSKGAGYWQCLHGGRPTGYKPNRTCLPAGEGEDNDVIKGPGVILVRGIEHQLVRGFLPWMW